LQDVGGDEDWHLYVQAVDSSSAARDLTPFKVGMQQLAAATLWAMQRTAPQQS
jgi:hypothetical protein